MANLLKAKRVSETETHYVDAETNDPVFIEHKKPAESRYVDDKYHVAIHPDFVAMHDLRTPHTHLSLTHQARTDQNNRDALESHYNDILTGKHNETLNPRVTLKHKGMHTQDDRTYRNYEMRDHDGELVGTVKVRHYKPEEVRERGYYGSDTENKIMSPDTRASFSEFDKGYLKKNKLTQELVDHISKGFSDTSTIGNKLEIAGKLSKYKKNHPAFVGGYTTPVGEGYHTNLKPKEAIEKLAAHIRSKTNYAPSELIHRGGSATMENVDKIHHFSYIPPKQGSAFGTVFHSQVEKNPYTKNETRTLIESWLDEIDMLNEVVDLGATEKTHLRDLNDVTGAKLLSDDSGHRPMQIGPKTRSGHVITYHTPTDSKENTTRYLTAHIEGEKAPHMTASLEVANRGVPAFTVNSLGAKDKEDRSIAAHEMYAHFLKHAPIDAVLVSDMQTVGGHEVWRKLAKTKGINVHGYDPVEDELHNTHPALDPEFDHETHGYAYDPKTQTSEEANKAMRMLLVAHRK